MLKDVTLKELAYVLGAFVCAAFASFGAHYFIKVLIGHHWGDLPSLAGGATFVFTLTLMLRGGADYVRNQRLEKQRQAMDEYVRKLNSN